VSHPKFYLFDSGVARALSGRLPYPPSPEELGPLLETVVLNEVRAFLSYSRLRYEVHFWRNHDGVEVDLSCETASGFVAVEVKAATMWQRRFASGLGAYGKNLLPGRCERLVSTWAAAGRSLTMSTSCPRLNSSRCCGTAT